MSDSNLSLMDDIEVLRALVQSRAPYLSAGYVDEETGYDDRVWSCWGCRGTGDSSNNFLHEGSCTWVRECASLDRLEQAVQIVNVVWSEKDSRVIADLLLHVEKQNHEMCDACGDTHMSLEDTAHENSPSCVLPTLFKLILKAGVLDEFRLALGYEADDTPYGGW